MAPGETSDEDFYVGLYWHCFSDLIVHDLQHFLIDHSYNVQVEVIFLEELIELGWGGEGFHSRFVGLLTQFSPK